MTPYDEQPTVWVYRESRATVLGAYRSLLFPRPKRPWWARLWRRG